VLFSVLALAAILGTLLRLPSPPVPVQAAVLGVLVATLGVPHGALDPLIARSAGIWRTPLGFAGFNLAYGAVVALVVAVWVVAPVASLVGFLLISGIHFGADWNTRRPLAVRAVTGVGLLTLPAFTHHDEVAGLYRVLSGAGGAMVADVQAWLGPVAVIGLALGAALAIRRRPSDALEIVLAGILAFVAPPLLFFAVYFCALHSARHLRHGFADQRGSGRLAALITVVYTVIPIAAVGILAAVFAGSVLPGGASDAALGSTATGGWVIRLVFIGLAALTVPHMMVIALESVRRRRGLHSPLVPAHTSPYDLPVYDLMHKPGEMRERALEFDAPERLGAGVVYVPTGEKVTIDVRLEGLHDGILVSAQVDTTAVGECVRCLDPITEPVQVEIQELFAYSPDEAFDFAVHDDYVDLEPVVRDAVVLSLPFQPVCRPDCPGLDPETGLKLADEPDRKPSEVLDPRWAALQDFTTDTHDADA
jgi:Brp/Blh family beta-carotene 15,15'-monooxygenase